MFVQHKQLKTLYVSAGKINRLHISAGPVQLAFSGFTPQLCNAYLLRLSGSEKTLVVVAFYLTESHASVFFVPEQGEVTDKKADHIYEEGFLFIESMGFILSDTDYSLLTEAEQQNYWYNLPISQPPQLLGRSFPGVKGEAEQKRLRAQSVTSLGRFLGSM